jgi:hypothetical protein
VEFSNLLKLSLGFICLMAEEIDKGFIVPDAAKRHSKTAVYS